MTRPPPLLPSFIAALLRQHRKLILDAARCTGVPPFEREDVFQRVALELTSAPDTIPRGGDLRPWLRAVARRLASDHLAENRRELPLPLQVIERLCPPVCFQGRLIRRQTRNVVRAAVRRLSRPLRLIWLLHEFRGLTLHQIAARLRLPFGTVATRYLRARKQLTARLLRRAELEEKRPGGRSFAIFPFWLLRQSFARGSGDGAGRAPDSRAPDKSGPSRAHEERADERSGPGRGRALCLAATLTFCALLPWHTLPRLSLNTGAVSSLVVETDHALARPAPSLAPSFVHGARSPHPGSSPPPAPRRAPASSLGAASLAKPPRVGSPEGSARLRGAMGPSATRELASRAHSDMGPPMAPSGVRSVPASLAQPSRDLIIPRTWLGRAQRAIIEGDLDLARRALRGYDDSAPDNPFPDLRRSVVRALEGGRR